MEMRPRHDLTGKTFGRLTAIERGSTVKGHSRWRCRCACGAERLVYSSSLLTGNTASCGCLRVERTSARHLVDISGKRFGRLVAQHRVGNETDGSRWLFLCDCGDTKVIRSKDVRRGATSSCGCISSENTTARNTKHGHARRGQCSPELITWVGMISRCEHRNNTAYANYGGRGIAVCDRWRESFANFLEDMGKRPAGMSIDRIDNDAGYSPENCRWATATEQARNKRTTLMLEHNGQTLPLATWAERSGINYGVLARRISLGWTPERVITQPARRQHQDEAP